MIANMAIIVNGAALMSDRTRNIAYIDGQNLYIGTAKSSPKWQIDMRRFRVYLREKYNVDDAYYYLGYINDGKEYQRLYEQI